MPARRILVIDDEANQRTALARMIANWGYDTCTAEDGEDALVQIAAREPDAIVTDLNMPRLDGAGLLKRLQSLRGAPPAIVLTAFGNLETALHTIHDLGAFWFLEKPIHSPSLRMLLDRAVAQRGLAAYAEGLERELTGQGRLGELLGNSPAMRQLFASIQQVAPTRATVLITGESGTGKELTARAIHAASPRLAQPFFALNCAALPESLIESELFGHEKGAFTGALERRRGCFELAHGGTLLLDEVGEMPLATQAKLLRVLEDRKVRRLGAATEIETDVRLLAATNRPLDQAVRDGRFRQDLYFRLNVFQIALPPLRDRLTDIPLLTGSLLATFNQRHQCHVEGVSTAAFAVLANHHWPGNVRELRNVIERAVIVAGRGTIEPEHLPSAVNGREPEAVSPVASLALEPGVTIEEAERRLIELTLRHTGNNRTRAAALLGVSVKTLFNKLREYGRESEDAVP